MVGGEGGRGLAKALKTGWVNTHALSTNTKSREEPSHGIKHA